MLCRLVAQVVALTRKLSAATGEGARDLQQRIAELEEQLAKRNRMLFSPSSEQRPSPKPDKRRDTPQTGHGPKPQPRLAVVENTHTLDSAGQGLQQLRRRARRVGGADGGLGGD
ncbi:MAG: hypothetical protein WBV82_21635 [Myxococcaceae bacterium]